MLFAAVTLAGCGTSVDDVRSQLKDRLCRDASRPGAPVAVYERPPAVYDGDGTRELGFISQQECSDVEFQGTLGRVRQAAPETGARVSAWFLVSAGPLEGWINLDVVRDLPFDMLPDTTPAAETATGLPDLAFELRTEATGVEVGDPCFGRGPAATAVQVVEMVNEGSAPITAEAITVGRWRNPESHWDFGPDTQGIGTTARERIQSGRPWTAGEAIDTLRAMAERTEADTLIWPARNLVLVGNPLPEPEPVLTADLVALANHALEVRQAHEALPVRERTNPLAHGGDPVYGYYGSEFRGLTDELTMWLAKSTGSGDKIERLELLRPLEPGDRVSLGSEHSLILLDLDDEVEEVDERNNLAYAGGAVGETLVCGP